MKKRWTLMGFLLLTSLVPAWAQGVITTVAGGGAVNGLPAVGFSAQFGGIAADALGNFYVTDDSFVYKVSPPGSVTVLASLTPRVGVADAYAIAVDSGSNVYVNQSSGVTRVDAVTGATSATPFKLTCGGGSRGTPSAVAVAQDGDVYASSLNGGQVFKMSAATGAVSLFAGAANPNCVLVVPDSGDGGPALNAQLGGPDSLAIGPSGDVYIGEVWGNAIRKVAHDTGNITTVVRRASPSLAFDTAGTLYFSGGGEVFSLNTQTGQQTLIAGGGSQNSDGIPATNAALGFWNQIAIASDGSLLITDFSNGRVRRVSLQTGVITTVMGAGGAGDGGPATSATLNNPFAITLDSSGNLYIGDNGSFRIRKVGASSGVINTVAGNGWNGNTGDGESAVNAEISPVNSMVVDQQGNLYLRAGELRKVDSTGTITTFSPPGSQPGGLLALDVGRQNLYSVIGGPQVVKLNLATNSTSIVAGNGANGPPSPGPATSSSFTQITALAVAPDGSIYIADESQGNVSALSTVWRVSASSGMMTLIAGGGSQGQDGVSALSTNLSWVYSLAVDGASNVYITQQEDPRVRRISGSDGTITSVTGGAYGNGYYEAYSGEGGPATSALLGAPQGLALDGSGNLYVADSSNNRVLRITGVAAPVPLSITTSSTLPPGVAGQPYSQTLAAISGAPPYTWSLSSGTLPAGLSLSSSGTIGGTPSTAGSSTFTIQVADTSSATATQAFSITIAPPIVPLAITTGSPLLTGSTGLPYTQVLSATGGTPPYNWSVLSGSGSLPGGLNLSASGSITGTPTAIGTFSFTAQVTDAAMVNATQKLNLSVISAGTPVRSGGLAHIAAGGAQWSTVITLFNTSSSPVAVTVVLHADDGSIVSTMPVTTALQGVTQTVSGGSINAVLNPNASLLISAGDPSQPQVIGWADVLSSGPVGGFAIFRSSLGTPSEGTVPLQTQLSSALVLPYDNTAGFVMGVALANLSASSATITATMWDDSGNSLGSQPIAIAGSGHTSFVLTTQLPATAGKRGIVRFQTNATGGISGLGLRFSPFGTFTSVPVMPQ